VEKPDDESEELEDLKENEETEELNFEVPEEDDLEPEDEKTEFVEAKKSTKTEEDQEDIVEERFYTIPLRNAWISPRKKRAPKAARIVRKFVMKHMKVRTEVDEEDEPEKLVIDNEVNEKLWSRGIEKPPRKIRVRVVKNTEGVVTVLLAEGD
jgi:large subunit ribosomal protein L31e